MSQRRLNDIRGVENHERLDEELYQDFETEADRKVWRGQTRRWHPCSRCREATTSPVSFGVHCRDAKQRMPRSWKSSQNSRRRCVKTAACLSALCAACL